MKDHLITNEKLYRAISKLKKRTANITEEGDNIIIDEIHIHPPPGGGGGGGGSIDFIWVDGTTIYIVNVMTDGDFMFYSETGGIAIGAGKTPGTPSDEEVKIDALLDVDIDAGQNVEIDAVLNVIIDSPTTRIMGGLGNGQELRLRGNAIVLGAGTYDPTGIIGGIFLSAPGKIKLNADNGGIEIVDAAITSNLDPSANTFDIGAATAYDEIYCDHITTSGGVYDMFDDIALIKQIRGKPDDPTKIASDSLPDLLKINRDDYMRKAILRVDSTIEKARGSIKSNVATLTDKIALEQDPQRKQKLEGQKGELEELLKSVGADRQEQLEEWKQRYNYVSQHFIPLDKTVSLLMGAVKQVADKLDTIEARLTTLESR